VGCLAVALALTAPAARAGGAWVPEPGAADIQLGYSVKTANTSWDPKGDTRVSDSWHIFRYVYASGEVGLAPGVSLRYLSLYLDGLEGPRRDMEHNAGLSELFLGVKFELRDGSWPMALAANLRTSYLYDLPGQYDRHLFLEDEDDFDGDGDVEDAIFKGVSPEWRGLLGEDYGLSWLVSRSLLAGRGWWNLEVGYTYRTTNLSDEIPLYTEIGYPLPWQDLVLKGTYRWVQSAGNHDATDRDPEDRFGCSETNCFPDASVMVLGGSLYREFGARHRWWVDLGFNQWIWGRSARKYEEPFLAVGRRF
jgi:hypothetical protein